MGNISCRAGEILARTSYLLRAEVWRENGKTKEREGKGGGELVT